MRRALPHTAIVITLLCLIQAGIWLWNSKTPATSMPQREAVKLPPQKKDVVVVPQTFEWAGLSEEELQMLSGHFGGGKSPSDFAMKKVVVSGTTIITDVYEGRPGEFVCSKLTPTIKKLKDGTEAVEVHVDCTSFTVSGKQNVLFSRFGSTHQVKSGNSKSVAHLTPDGNYAMGFGVKIKGGDEVEIEASSQFHALPKAQGADD